MNPNVLLALDITASMWSFQVRVLFIVIPRYLYVVAVLSGEPLRKYRGSGACFLERVMCKTLCKTLVLQVFSFIAFVWLHLSSWVRSDCRAYSSLGDLMGRYMTASSANKKELEASLLDVSLMKMLKSKEHCTGELRQ